MKKKKLQPALLALLLSSHAAAQTFTPYTAGTADVYASAPATGRYNDGSTIVLNDLEDHHWTLYSDPESPIKSLYPRNVQIIYSGYGMIYNGGSTPGDLAAEQPESLTPLFEEMTPGVNGQTVGVGAATPEERAANRFVYLKTLERGWP